MESWTIFGNLTNELNCTISGTNYTESGCQMWRFQEIKWKSEKCCRIVRIDLENPGNQLIIQKSVAKWEIEKSSGCGWIREFEKLWEIDVSGLITSWASWFPVDCGNLEKSFARVYFALSFTCFCLVYLILIWTVAKWGREVNWSEDQLPSLVTGSLNLFFI